MKSTYLLVSFFFIGLVSYAQEPADALRYSFLTQSSGTARNQAIGGAGASLGGEFSSLFINPAGLGFYKTSEFVFTPGYSIKNFTSTYKNNPATSNDNNFNLGATGFVASSSTPTKKVKSFTFAMGVTKAADFNDHIYYKGLNTTSSYSEKYLEELVDNNVTDPNNAATQFPSGSSLAFNTYLIDTVQAADGSISGYRSLANPAYGLIQENTINTSGGITDVSLGGALNLNEKWYFGVGLTFDFLNYKRDAHYKESDASGNPNNNFNYFEVNETLQTTGIGGNANFGVIYKPVEDVRVGLSFQIPTFYEGVTDKYSAEIVTDLEGYSGAGIREQSSFDLNNGQLLEAQYNLTTPLKIIAGGSYVIHEVADVKQQRGFITADVEYVNYKGASFHSTNSNSDSKDYYSSLNSTIDNLYKNAINVRLGGELKFNTIMFRLGGAYYSNPYKNETANLIKVSGGLGYRDKGFFIDLTYVYSLDKDINYPYLLQDKPDEPAYLRDIGGNIVLSFGIKL